MVVLEYYVYHQTKFGNPISCYSISQYNLSSEQLGLKLLRKLLIFFRYLKIFSADGNYEVRYKSNVLIYPNGEVLWVPPAIYQVGIPT